MLRGIGRFACLQYVSTKRISYRLVMKASLVIKGLGIDNQETSYS